MGRALLGDLFLLALLHLVLGLLQILAHLHEALAEILDFLVLFGLDLVDGDVFFAVDVVELDGDLLDLVFLLVEFALELAKVGLEKQLTLASALLQLLLQPLYLQLEGSDPLVLFVGVHL